ncbi:MAG: hypothetical protein LUO98_07550 [Methanoregula sp.]|nr:hypothetical protein [Methanoregula sp.]
MRVPEILGIDAVRFVEPAFAAQTDRIFNNVLAAAAGDEGRLLLDEGEEPLALAFHGPGGWVAASFLYRNPSVELIEKFENVNGQIFEEDRDVFSAAVREYYSSLLSKEVPPAIEDLNPARRGILTLLVEKHWGKANGETCVDCCCGSGIGSLVLRDLGYAPLSYDNDASLLARGLATGRLLPDETMCIDARVASGYMRPVPRGIGIMMGEINTFTQELWEVIIRELLAMSQETLITVGTESEARMIRDWGAAMERTVEVAENPADPIYDRWVCTATQK